MLRHDQLVFKCMTLHQLGNKEIYAAYPRANLSETRLSMGI